MPILNLENFAKAVVSTGYDAAATSIVVNDASALPTAPFNAVWYDSTTYPNPADDPQVEIVRVTNVVGETLTITRAQEGTSASTKNTAAKTYLLNVPPTKALFDGLLHRNTSSDDWVAGDTPNQETVLDVQNSTTGDGDAHARVRCISGGATGGDGVVTFSTQVQNWTAGVDNSSSDEFKIASTADLGNEDRVAIGTDGHVAIGTAPSADFLLRVNEGDLTEAGILIAHDAGTGDAQLAIRTDDGGGDVYVSFQLRGTPDVDWTIGVDDTDDAFKVSSSTALGTDDRLVIGTDGLVDVPGDLRVNSRLGFATSELTIATGAITVTGTAHTVDTESDSASDDLDTVNGGSYDGQLLILSAEDDARDVVLKHGTGNLALTGAADFTLDSTADRALLVWDTVSSTWYAVALSSNG